MSQGPREFPSIVKMAAATVVVAGLWFASPILVPVALSILISFAVAPLVSRLERWRFGRVGSVAAVALLGIALVAGIATFVAGQAADLAAQLPKYRGNLSKKFEVIRKLDEKWKSATGELVRANKEPEGAERTEGAPGAAGPAPVPSAPPSGVGDFLRFRGGAVSFIQFLLAAGGVLVLVCFILLQRHDLHARALRVARGGRFGASSQALNEAAEKVSQYLLAQTALNALYGGVIAAGLYVLGIPNALIWGLLCALLRYMPYIGTIIGAALPVALSLAVSSSWVLPTATIGLFVAVDLVVNNVIEPFVQGRSTGLSPVAILASAAFWGWLWGPVGLILSTPLTACLFVVGKYYPPLHFFHVLMGREADRSLASKLYQHLVSAEYDAAWEAVSAEVKRSGLAEALDATLVPVLEMVKRDRHTEQLDLEGSRRVIREIEEMAEEAVLEAKAGSDTPAAAAGDVLCVPTRDDEDAAGCLMLARVLGREGIAARTCLPGAVTSQGAAARQPSVICVLDIRTASARRLQHLARSLRARFPGVPIVAARLPADVRSQAGPAPEALHSASTLDECREVVKRLLAQEPPAAAPPPAADAAA